jgi:hypothetical protein
MPARFLSIRRRIAGMLSLRDIRDGFRILCSRSFWREFNAFWFDSNRSTSLVARMDDWTSAARKNTGQEPDQEVERRRAQRRAHRAED